MSSQMEDPKKHVIGYPVELNYPPHQPTMPAATATFNTTNANVEQPPPPPTCANAIVDRLTWKNCLQFLVSVAFFSFLVYLGWLLDRPLRAVEFHVKSLTVSPFNVSATQITANWNITFFVRNPNKKTSISYEMIQASLFYKEELLSKAIIGSFSQEPMNETLVHVESWTRNAIITDIVEHRVVDFNIMVEAMLWVDGIDTRVGQVHVRVSCDHVTVEFSSNENVGSMLGADKKCKGHLGAILK